jgi:hypothetical protein
MKGHNWEDYEKSSGPVALAFKVFAALFIVGMPLGIVGHVLGWFGEAATVVREEFGPREALRKYEWFKDAAAQLEKKQADMKVYDGRLKSLGDAYPGKSRGEWAREDREQWSIWQSEAAGVRASFNTLAAEYNAQMAKFNWRFAEGGRLPDGSSSPLPREFKSYEEK